MDYFEDEDEEESSLPRTLTYDPLYAQALKEKALGSKTIEQLWAENKGIVAVKEEEEEERDDDNAPRRLLGFDPQIAEAMKKRAIQNMEEDNNPTQRTYSTTQSVPTVEKVVAQSMDEKCKQVIGKMRSLTSKYEADLAALQSELGVHNGGRKSRKLVRRQKKRVSRK